MKKISGITAGGLVAATVVSAAALLSAPSAMAHDQARVNWSVSIGTPYYPATYAAPVYSPPPVVYVQPQSVYVQPQPVYVESEPVAQYRSSYYYSQPQPYYPVEGRYRGHRHWKHHHHYQD